MFRSMQFISLYLWIFHFPPLIHFEFHTILVRKDTMHDFNLLKFADLLCDLYDLSYRIFHMHLRRMCILLLGGMFYICLFGSFGLKYSSVATFPYWFSVWVIYPLLKVECWSPLLIFVLLSISPFGSVSTCLKYLGAPILGTYMFMIILYSW